MNSLVFTYYCTSMSKERNTTIDFMRGLAIFLMILIHVTAHFLQDKTVYLLWDYTHFAVPLFIFCSAYLSFTGKEHKLTFPSVISRVGRLLRPYYIFLLIYFSYIFLIKQDQLPMQVILDKVFLLNAKSADLEWLVVLFLSFILLFPLIQHAAKKPLFLFVLGIMSGGSAIYLLFADIPIPFRHMMWLPWIFYIVMVYSLVQEKKSKWFIPVVILFSAIVFIVSRSSLMSSGESLTLTHNKYPPNIFYLSYGVFWTFFLYWIHPKLHIPKYIDALFSFFSRYSYPIFFIHFLIIYIFLDFVPFRKLQWWGFLIIVLILTISGQLILNKINAIKRSFPLFRQHNS